MNVKVVENTFEVICDSRMLYELLKNTDVKRRWEIIDNIQRRFCKKVVRGASSIVYGAAEW